MKKISILFFLCVGIFSLNAQDKIKVACIGNSITFGSGVVNRIENSYPAQLQTYLGEEYIVENFGVSGTTVLSKGDYPYINRGEYKASLEFNPDIVFIKLGTNDSKIYNMVHFDDYKYDYQKIIDSYKKLESKPRIILITPIRCYLPEGNGISNVRMVRQVTPIVKELAYENNIEIFDGYSIFSEDFQSHIMPDRLHPSSIGAGIMAENFYRLFEVKKDYEFNIFEALGSGEEFNFHGFKGRNYAQNGLEFKVVQPKIANKTHSWVLRARFWGHEPQLDQKLLELGFHVVYCDVENLYGSDSAVQRWNKFYKVMTAVGLNEKVVLEGMSRGGVIVYNWAVENLDKVSAIYADAPVLDLKSWPMSKSESDTKRMLEVYGMTKEQMLEFKGNPIDHAVEIAKATIPIIHVVGDADTVVPVDDNTSVFAERLNKAGGVMEIINKKDVGHHPHSLVVPNPILKFILKAENLLENICVKPIRGNEYRAGAGWKNGADWNLTAADITTTLKEQNVDILMLGNSITQGFAVNRKLVGSCKNNKVLNDIFNGLSWESAGISGDRTQHLLWRVQNGEYNAANPKYVTIAIGVNNVDDDAQSVYEGIIAVTKATLKEFPTSDIILFGMLPTAGSPKRVDKYNMIIDKLDSTEFDSRVLFVDPRPYFTDEEGGLRMDLYGADLIHIKSEGYKAWAELIMKSIKLVSN